MNSTVQPISPGAAAPAGLPANLSSEVTEALALQGLRKLLFAPIPKLAEALADLDREQLGMVIEVMIAVLDATEPDPEAEEIPTEDCAIAYSDFDDFDPDDLEACEDADLEDDGCGEPDADSFGDPAWVEWHVRTDKLDDGITGRGEAAHEDSEESDDAGDAAHEDNFSGYAQFKGHPGPGCAFSDSGIFPVYRDDQSEPEALDPHADRRIFAPHRNKMRLERCIALNGRDEQGRTHRLFPLWDGGRV